MKRILVIDDSEIVRKHIKQVLASTGYDVVEAVDGIDGLEKVRGTSDLALVLCDVNMPRMNGLDMVAELHRSGPKTTILMLTTEGQPSLILKARELGAKGWIVKPFKPELLIAAVTKFVEATAKAS